MQQAARDGNIPTQAKTGIEWATRPSRCSRFSWVRRRVLRIGTFCPSTTQ
jgi:hypothetical protein